jgi:hypothetical protein
MKKCAVIFSCALLACVFAGENRASGQGKKPGQAKKAPQTAQFR